MEVVHLTVWRPYMNDYYFYDGHIRFKDAFGGYGPIGNHSYSDKFRRVVRRALNNNWTGDPACEFACSYLNAKHGLIGLTTYEVASLYEAYITSNDYHTGAGNWLAHHDILPFLMQTHTYV